jgi:hypothetical protein
MRTTRALKKLYPVASQLEIMQAFPRLSWASTKHHAWALGADDRIGIRKGRIRINPYHRTMAYQDLAAAAALVKNTYEQERLQEVANALSEETKRGQVSAHWWLPLDEISYLADFEDGDYYDNGGINDNSHRRYGYR